MPDRQFKIGGLEPTPADWIIPDSLEVTPKSVYAHFDGSGAAGAFKPCLRIVSDSGTVAIEAVTDTAVAAGASADVSWFPRIASTFGGGNGLYPLTITGVVATNVAINAGEFVPVDCSTSDVQLTLPNAPADQTICAAMVYARSFTATHAVTFKCAGVDTFAGSGNTSARIAQTQASTHQGQTMFVQYVASLKEWFIIANNLPVGTNDNAIVTLTPDQAGGGTIAIDLRNSNDWTAGVMRLPNNKTLGGHNAAGNNTYDIVKTDTANPPFIVFGDSAAAGLKFNCGTGAVTGSRGGNAALASLLTVLATAGFLVDNTTP